MGYGPFTIAIDEVGRGPFGMVYVPSRDRYPMTAGDSGSPEHWNVEGPAHVAQSFHDPRIATAFCAVLNALYHQKPFEEL